MMKKLLIWLMVIMLCLSVVPSFAEGSEDDVEKLSKVVKYTAESGEKVKFKSEDIRTAYKNAGFTLEYVTFELPGEEEGTLYYGKDYSTVDKETFYYDSETGEDPFIDRVVLELSEEVEKDLDITYYAYDKNGENKRKGVIRINIEVSSEKEGLFYEVAGKSVEFIADDFYEVLEEEEEELRYVIFGKPSEGKLYYQYEDGRGTAVRSEKYYYDEEPYINDISYVPAADAEGEVTIPYTAYGEEGSFPGIIHINVLETEGEELEDIEVTVTNGKYIKFLARKFKNACEEAIDEELSYVVFELPAKSKGTLYYNYSEDKDTNKEVSDEIKYYCDSSKSNAIDNISFVPKSSFFGNVRISYHGCTTDKTVVNGDIIITVPEDEEDDILEGEIETISYDSEPGKRVRIDPDEIHNACKNAGITYKYIKFETVSVEDEYKIYNGTASATKSTKFYKDTEQSTNVENIRIKVSEEATKNFAIKYQAYFTDKEFKEGVIKIVIDSPYDGEDVYYKLSGEVVEFKANDFRDKCEEELGTDLDYVMFEKPSNGTLYYDYYDEDGDRGSVSTSKKYYYRKSPYLNSVAYLPKDNYKGTVYIDYEGFDKDQESFTGTIVIDVDTSDVEEAADIKYSVKNTSYKTFSSSNFTSVCTKATDEKLEYIKFTLPSSSQGTLYYKYSSSKDDDNEKVSSSTKYYVNEADYIKYVTFVPKSGYKGTVNLKYTGYTEEGTCFTGVVKIEVTGTTTSSSTTKDDDEDAPKEITYKGEKGKAVEFDGDDFYDVCDDYYGDDLEYVTFTIPSSTYGTLWYDYDGNDEEAVKKGEEYYYEDDDMLISDVSFVPERAGKITIKYTAYTVEEDDFDGTIVINVAASGEGNENFKFQKMYNTGIFSDVDEDQWYGSKQTGAIKLAYRYGLMSGRADGTFDPSGSITVAEALTIASRVHDIYYNNKTTFKAGNTWYEEYVDYAIEQGIVSKKDFTNYDRAISREEMAYIFANIIPDDAMEEINDVGEIPDVDEDNKYYYEILYLYNVGVLSGSDAKGTFNPKANISRAEVSAIIVRVADPDERRENNF